MRRLSLAITFLLGTCIAAWGQSPAVLATVVLNGPSKCYVGNTFDIQFTRTVACLGNIVVPIARFVSITRTTVGNARNSAGIWQAFASGALRETDIGVLVENAATNLALQSRDMTQSGTWVATNMTTALNAVGIDGVSNAASTITATAGNALLIQSLTLTSASRTASVFVKCVTCTGNIQYSNSAILSETFTTLDATKCVNPITGVGTAPNTSNFVRCSISAVTALNPVIGFKIVNNGDSVIVDANQLETASLPTSPIYTTSGTVTRNADDVQLNAAGIALITASGTYCMEWSQDYVFVAGTPYLFRKRVDSTNGLEHFMSSSSGVVHYKLTATGVQQFDLVSSSGVAAGISYRDCNAFTTNDGAAAFTSSLQATIVTTNSLTIDASAFTLGIGQSPGGVLAFNGYMRRFLFASSRLGNSNILSWAQSTPGTFP